jgi:hypothetical protein
MKLPFYHPVVRPLGGKKAQEEKTNIGLNYKAYEGLFMKKHNINNFNVKEPQCKM